MALVGVAYVLLVAVTLVSNFVLIPTHVVLILMSFLSIYIGAHRSLDAPPSQDAMKAKDAWMFPVFGSMVLGTLYLLFTNFDKETINMLMTAYFLLLGVLAVTGATHPGWTAVANAIGLKADKEVLDKTLPLLGEVKLDVADMFALPVAIAFGAWYVMEKHWVANNIIGLSFCISGVEQLNVGSYKTGAILLSGLFFYDIFWVFGTDVMVTVAKSVDGPIKLLFPRSFATEDTDAQFSLLGLGDIVIPGVFIALMLRVDRQKHADKQSLADAKTVSSNTLFPKPYFNAVMVAYVLGLIATVVVMVVFEAAQPALLYLVPACLGSTSLTALLRGEFRSVIEYEEEEEGETEPEEQTSEEAGGILGTITGAVKNFFGGGGGGESKSAASGDGRGKGGRKDTDAAKAKVKGDVAKTRDASGDEGAGTDSGNKSRASSGGAVRQRNRGGSGRK